MTPISVYIAIEFADKSVGIMQFVCEQINSSGGVVSERLPTPDAIEAEIAKTAFDKHLLPIASWRLLGADRPKVPPRDFREAWRLSGEEIRVDMDAARVVAREKLRHMRAHAMPALDNEWMRAMGQKDRRAIEEAEKKRVRWRDAPADPAIANAARVEDLLAVLSAYEN